MTLRAHPSAVLRSVRVVAAAAVVALLLALPVSAADPLVLREREAAIRLAAEETGVPAVAAVLVEGDDTVWSAALGVADRGSGRPATLDTPFRLGSVSKTFVSLAVMLLVEEGRLALDDRVRDLAPEIEFRNPWQTTHPVRVAHLLEHTTGFDDIHPREYASSDPTPLSLVEGLAFHPRSRVSRWRPGSYYSYCNSGPPIAAYLVEKVSGQSFEEFVGERVLEPLEMSGASYFRTPELESRLAVNYRRDGITPEPYWHISLRPSGALNATAPELANLVRLLLNRGSFGGAELLPPESIERMETPRSSAAARAGLRLGYGLGIYSIGHAGFVLHGHAGGVNGGIAEYAYSADLGRGYVLVQNSGQGAAFVRMRKILRDFVVRDATPPEPAPAVSLAAGERDLLGGWYEPLVVRQELGRFLVRWGLLRVRAAEGELSAGTLMAERHPLVPVGPGLFRVGDSPEASVAVTPDGLFQAAAGPLSGTYRRVPTARVWLQWAVAVFCLLALASAVLSALIWIPRRLFRRTRELRAPWARVVPLAAVLTLAAAFTLVTVSVDQMVNRFGLPTVWSVGTWALLWLYPVLSAAGLIAVVSTPRLPETRWVRWHGLLVSVANLVVALYLAWFGIVGYRTWA